MSDIIKATSHSPVFGHTVVGPAAPTVAEGLLRREFEALREENAQLRSALHARVDSVEIVWAKHISTIHDAIIRNHDRLSSLESRWYERVVLWFRKVFSCR
jgi:hypothetical protein